MAYVQLDYEGFSELTRSVVNLDGVFARARKSALKSVGWHLRGWLRDYVEKGGEGWPALHPLTARFRHKRGVLAHWVKRQNAKTEALGWLGKFARYRVEKDESVMIAFGKSRVGKLGREDPELAAIAQRAESGESIAVTPAMRHFLAATRRKRPKAQEAGGTYFPLRKSTTRLKTPKRPIFEPVWRKYGDKTLALFEEKFWAAYNEYTGGPKRSGKE